MDAENRARSGATGFRPPDTVPRPLKQTLQDRRYQANNAERRREIPRWALVVSAALLLLLALQSATVAHAFLDKSEPKVGSDVSSAPTEVKISFTQKVEPAFSKIEVFDSDGHQVDKKDSHVDVGDHAILIVSLPKLGEGTFKVVWSVVSVDTHRTKGDFKFVVKR